MGTAAGHDKFTARLISCHIISKLLTLVRLKTHEAKAEIEFIITI